MRGAAWTKKPHSSALERVLSLRHLRWMRVDWHLLLIGMALLAVGIVFIGAMSSMDERLDREGVELGSHLKKVVAALPALLIGLCLRPRWLRRNSGFLYAVTIVMLLLVPFIGEERNNARRWIPLPGGVFDLQPSELAKIGLILMLATSLYTNRLRNFVDWVRPLLWAVLPMALVALQPDLGTALTIVPVTLGMFYLAGARARTLLWGLALCGVAGYAAIELGVLHKYQLQRVDTWFESWAPESLIAGKQGPAFHPYQARLAIGNGGFWGQGLGRGVANEAGHLPERDCDSIFAVIAEEGGFLGGLTLLVLYALFVISILASASPIRERFTRLVVGGLGLYFGAHFFINVGVNLGLVPMTGLNLPLISTGGSSLLASFLALGLALGLSSHQEPTLDQDAFRS